MKNARDIAHSRFDNACAVVVKVLRETGQQVDHSPRCDQDTALIEARDAEWAASTPGSGSR